MQPRSHKYIFQLEGNRLSPLVAVLFLWDFGTDRAAPGRLGTRPPRVGAKLERPRNLHAPHQVRLQHRVRPVQQTLLYAVSQHLINFRTCWATCLTGPEIGMSAGHG